MALHISPSKLSSWNRCRKQFDYGYNKNWEPKKRREYLDIGTEVHQLLEKYYKQGHMLNIQAEIEARMPDLDEDDLKPFQLAIMVVKRYVEDYAPKADLGWEVVAVEHYFDVPMVTPSGNEFILEGYIDLLMKQLEYDKLWAWDHKTGTRMLTPAAVMMDAQLPTYAGALREMGVPIHGLLFNLINTYDYKNHLDVPTDKLFKRLQTYRTPIELNNFIQELYRQVDDLVENQDKIFRNLNKECPSCFFHEPCLMGMKGADEQDTLEMEFKQRGPRPRKEGVNLVGTNSEQVPDYGRVVF